MREIPFYQGHLDRVSRSFALCISMLDSPFREWISLSYLLCRALDTIEDSHWPDTNAQDLQYSEFKLFLESLPSRETVANWAARFPDGIPEGERHLVQDAYDLFNDLHELPAPAREVIRTAVLKMYRGMEFYSHRASGGALRLIDLADTNRYCYFVAGVVGELLSGLYLVYRPKFVPGADFKTNALHFGLFLQKINLLKDQLTDEKEGRFLIPDRQLVLASLRKNAVGAMNYLLSIPPEEKGYRMFCAISLFLGAASLPWMQQAFDAQDGGKIPRSVTRELISGLEEIIRDDRALRSAFEEYLPLFPETPAQPSSIESATQWFVDLSGGTLAVDEMADLGIL